MTCESDAVVRRANAVDQCQQIIAKHSKSFHFASKLLPANCRADTAVLYAWCRRADDAIDDTPAAQQADELARLRAELDGIYGGRSSREPVLAAFADIVQRHRIPRAYPSELLAGMAMDVEGTHYDSMETLLLYCYRVASTVGLMMSHIMGLHRESAMPQAAHLGVAMQLTNICRDVEEDWNRERLYVPTSLLEHHGGAGLCEEVGMTRWSSHYDEPLAASIRSLLSIADRYYTSADKGMEALPWRAALGVRAARLIYADIGRKLVGQNCDPSAGRAYVTKGRKIFLATRALTSALGSLPKRAIRQLSSDYEYLVPSQPVEFSRDVLRC